MRFEVSERVSTSVDESKLIKFAENQLKKIANRVWNKKGILSAKSIEATFGSINRHDITTVSFQPNQGGYLVVAETRYRPSLMFWVFFVAGVFTYVGWIIPIIFYLYQRSTVKSAMEAFTKRIKNEFDNHQVSVKLTDDQRISELQALADLHAKGILDDAEFQHEKSKLLAR